MNRISEERLSDEMIEKYRFSNRYEPPTVEDVQDMAQELYDRRQAEKEQKPVGFGLVTQDGILQRDQFYHERIDAIKAANSADELFYVVPLCPTHSLVQQQFNLAEFIKHQKDFSSRAFGPNFRWKGIVEHIRKELKEIESNPTDLFEWIDVAILALDGAWRAGYEPEQICLALNEKLEKNKSRSWPDWRELLEDGVIEHDRTSEASNDN